MSAMLVQLSFSASQVAWAQSGTYVSSTLLRRDAPILFEVSTRQLRTANVFVAEGIGKCDRFGELTGAYQEARAVHIPLALADHDSLIRDLRLRASAPDFPA